MDHLFLNEKQNLLLSDLANMIGTKDENRPTGCGGGCIGNCVGTCSGSCHGKFMM